VIFAFHGYQRLVHQVVHGRPNAERFHVRGFNEQGSTTTPFDMVVLNGMSRYHLCIEALRRSDLREDRTQPLISECLRLIEEATGYAREHFEDIPSVRDWTWTD
jgi:xylulose-5-phosphate/fructose-6-phosphate phosphoketolase